MLIVNTIQINQRNYIQSTISSTNRQNFENCREIPAGLLPEFYQGIPVQHCQLTQEICLLLFCVYMQKTVSNMIEYLSISMCNLYVTVCSREGDSLIKVGTDVRVWAPALGFEGKLCLGIRFLAIFDKKCVVFGI